MNTTICKTFTFLKGCLKHGSILKLIIKCKENDDKNERRCLKINEEV